jgi:vancomycin resistance protein VanK
VAPLRVTAIDAEQHLSFVRAQRSASFLQTPGWGRVKREWRSESLGWFDGDRLVGVGLVLHRSVPRLNRTLAYLPEGPLIAWADDDLAAWLDPMVGHLRARGAFAVRMGPPVVVRTWDTASVKQGIASEGTSRLSDLPPTTTSPEGAAVRAYLASHGWRRLDAEDGFAAGQPAFNFWLPLAGRTTDEVLSGMNQLWRRNIRKAEKAGVVVTTATPETFAADLAAFHELYVQTAERDHFIPRPLSYFSTMFAELGSEEPDRITLYLARHEGDVVAATIGVRVGHHVWYSYGASSTHKREVRGSNAVQWAMIRDALEAGADVYDLRGITETLSADDPHAGLIQFKVGTGGQAVEYTGEWDLPLRRLLYRAFDLYLRIRQGG